MTSTDIDMLVLVSGRKAIVWGKEENGHINGEIIINGGEEKLKAGGNGKNGGNNGVSGNNGSDKKPADKPAIPPELLTCCDNKVLLPYRGAKARSNGQELLFCANCGQIWALKTVADHAEESYLTPIVQ